MPSAFCTMSRSWTGDAGRPPYGIKAGTGPLVPDACRFLAVPIAGQGLVGGIRRARRRRRRPADSQAIIARAAEAEPRPQPPDPEEAPPPPFPPPPPPPPPPVAVMAMVRLV